MDLHAARRDGLGHEGKIMQALDGMADRVELEMVAQMRHVVLADPGKAFGPGGLDRFEPGAEIGEIERVDALGAGLKTVLAPIAALFLLAVDSER